MRHGDRSEPSAVRVFTKDGNAESGKDYNPVSKGKKFLFQILPLRKALNWIPPTKSGRHRALLRFGLRNH